jgi:cytochrome c peroxidase
MWPISNSSKAAWLLATAALVAVGDAQAQTRLQAEEIALLASLGPWPAPIEHDPSNALSGTKAGIALGRALFRDKRLSGQGDMSCASCHTPRQGFAEARALSQGRQLLTRNSPSLWNQAGQRWFAWDGASDSLWMHSIKPLLNPLEMGASHDHIAQLLQSDPKLAALRRRLPAHNLRADAGVTEPESLTVTAAKALAAFTETLRSPRTPFDRYRDAVLNQDWAQAKRYPENAERGFKLFVGKANCISCHAGPNFTNGEFADTGLGHFIRVPGRESEVDSGRHGGVSKVIADRYNLLGGFSDTPPSAATHTRYVKNHHALFGQFKVPSLRELKKTGPYMHDGRLASLQEVVRHYSTVSPDRLHSDGEKSLKALGLSQAEAGDLLGFLESLTGGIPHSYSRAASTKLISP